MKAYSLDFRQQIMEVHYKGKSSQRQLVQRFNVALSFIEKLIKQEKETGSIAPKGHGGAKAKLTDAQKQMVADLMTADNDATLALFSCFRQSIKAESVLGVKTSIQSIRTQRILAVSDILFSV